MNDEIPNPWEAQRAAMGAFIRSQRELANMSLRELSRATQVSNAYLSQLERGLHDPTLRVLVQIGDALQLSVEEILRRQATTGDAPAPTADPSHDDAADGSGGGPLTVENAIAHDPVLTEPEKEALLGVYRSYLRAAAQRTLPAGDDEPGAPSRSATK